MLRVSSAAISCHNFFLAGSYELRTAGADIGSSSGKRVPGGTAMAFCPAGSFQEEIGTCLVATEGKHVLRCQVSCPEPPPPPLPLPASGAQQRTIAW